MFQKGTLILRKTCVSANDGGVLRPALPTTKDIMAKSPIMSPVGLAPGGAGDDTDVNTSGNKRVSRKSTHPFIPGGAAKAEEFLSAQQLTGSGRKMTDEQAGETERGHMFPAK